MKLEDLFTIKKAEKPTQADWQKFDDQLRRKMLLSMIRKEPLHKRLFSRFGFRKLAIATAFVAPVFVLPVLFTNTGPSAANQNIIMASEMATLPPGATSFATNELANASEEVPVSAKLTFSDNPRVSYATNTLPANRDFIF